MLEETLALHEEAFQILKDGVDVPQKTIERLRKLEEDSREHRKALRQRGTDALSKLSDDAKKSFFEDANRRSEEYRTKLETVLKRYDEPARTHLRGILQEVTH